MANVCSKRAKLHSPPDNASLMLAYALVNRHIIGQSTDIVFVCFLTRSIKYIPSLEIMTNIYSMSEMCRCAGKKELYVNVHKREMSTYTLM